MSMNWPQCCLLLAIITAQSTEFWGHALPPSLRIGASVARVEKPAPRVEVSSVEGEAGSRAMNCFEDNNLANSSTLDFDARLISPKWLFESNRERQFERFPVSDTENQSHNHNGLSWLAASKNWVYSFVLLSRLSLTQSGMVFLALLRSDAGRSGIKGITKRIDNNERFL